MITVALWICAFFIGFGILCCLWRMLKGPHSADRVVALDLMGSIAIAIAIFGAVLYRSGVYLDVGIGAAVISFIGTVAFARYVENRS